MKHANIRATAESRRSGLPFAKLTLSHYGLAGVSGGGLREPIVREIRRIALLLRKHLPEQAAGVNTIIIVFSHESAAVREEIKLP